MGVSLCSSQRCVPKKFLYGGQVGAIVEHIRGKGMPEGMRRAARRLHIGRVEHRTDRTVHKTVVDRIAVVADKEDVRARLGYGCAAYVSVVAYNLA